MVQGLIEQKEIRVKSWIDNSSINQSRDDDNALAYTLICVSLFEYYVTIQFAMYFLERLHVTDSRSNLLSPLLDYC